MQQIIITNFLSVKYADIDIRKTLVLIGEQSKGKSAVAKLIYFFKSLSQNLFAHIYESETSFEFEIDILYQIKLNFYTLFGTKWNLQKFNIKYYYDVENEKYLQLSVNDSNGLTIMFSDNMFTENVIKNICELKELLNIPFNIFATELDKKIYESELKTNYNKLFDVLESIFNNSNNPLYIPAGRAITTSYSSLFEKYLFTNILNINNSDRKNANEMLMAKFLQRVNSMKSFFIRNNDFEDSIKTYTEDSDDRKSLLYGVKEVIEKILKGKYMVNNSGEESIFNTEGHIVDISELSTGQREIFRILQDIFMSMITNESVFRVIEEPESNLHPLTQKQLIELLCLLVNDNKDNQIVITTNSPYVLNILNNLLFATRVIRYNPDTLEYIDKYIPKKYHINPDEFSIYSLGNDGMEQDYCVDILSERSLIGQNYLDVISEILNNYFQVMYNLYFKSRNN